MAAQFVINPGGTHEVEAGAGYGAGDTRAPLADGPLQPERTTGAVFVKDRWHLSQRITATAGARYTYVGFC
jgi:outer membrane receptor protein involved in Fe transport